MKYIASILLFIGVLGAKAQSITVSEINYKSDLTRDCADWVELYNFGSNNIDLGGWSLIDSGVGSLPYVIPTGTILAPQNFLVIVRNISKFNTWYPTVTNKVGAFGFKLQPTDRIVLKNAANTTVVQVDFGDFGLWPDGADGEGRTLERKNINVDTGLSNPNNWMDGCIGGSPGKAYTPCNDPIVFSEINYNSDSSLDVSEFVELHNTTNADINIGGYELRDEWDSLNNIYTFPANTILKANDYLVVSNNTDSLLHWHSTLTKYQGNFTFNLNNGGEVIRLFNANKILQFSCHYRDTLGWPLRADGDSMTLELKTTFQGKVNDPNSWTTSCPGGSPGRLYSLPCPPLQAMGIADFSAQLAISMGPNPLISSLDVQLNPELFKKLQIRDAYGKLLFERDNLEKHNYFDLSQYAAGIYMLEAKTKNGHVLNKKLIKQ